VSDATEANTTSPATTIPPSSVSDDEAKERALAAEEAHLSERLEAADCLENWGTTATTASEEATVAERTGDGVRVLLQHPYWYSTDDTEADASSSAQYLVDAETAERVGGDDVDPC